MGEVRYECGIYDTRIIKHDSIAFKWVSVDVKKVIAGIKSDSAIVERVGGGVKRVGAVLK